MSYFKELLNPLYTTQLPELIRTMIELKGDIEPPIVEEIESAIECRKMSKARAGHPH